MTERGWLICAARTLGLVVTMLVPAAAGAQDPSVLRIARGLAANGITVIENRAVVVESAQPFIEVSVAQPNIADVSPLSDQAIYVFGRTRGVTTLTLLGEGGQLITNVPVEVIPDIGEMKARIRALMPDENVELRTAGGNVVLSGTVSSKERIDALMVLANAYAGGNVINMLTVGGTQQVMLKVRVAEMSREASKSLGIDLGLFGQGDNLSGVFSSGGPAVITPGGNASVGGVSIASSGLGLLARFGDFGINLAIEALEGKNFARTLAEPNIVALSGSSASFLVGGEVPVPREGEDGEIDITFKEVGVVLDFAPRVLTDEIINLQVSAEVSDVTGQQLDQGSVSVPTFATNRAATTVELKDGQSFAIAGLVRSTFSDDISQFPWLGDVPIIGTLFRSASYLNRESELVIIITAHLVTPVDDNLLAIPQDRIAIPNERDLFLLGETSALAPGIDSPTQGFDGDFGYVFE